MSKNITHILFILTMGALCSTAQVILPSDERDSLVGDMNEVLTNTDRESMDVSKTSSPFVEKKAEQILPASTDLEAPQLVREELPAELSDPVALRLISQQFKPLGSMVLGNRGLLQLSGGNTIEQGETFNAEIKGRSYEVLIEEVTGSGYTLRLGSAIMRKTFLTTQTNPKP